MAPDQRYCLSCGSRRGEPRAAPAPTATQAAAERPTTPVAPAAAGPEPASRPADVSPLAAVIGIALLGGMLLIGVLIGRGAEDDPAPAPVVTVGGPSSSSSGGAGGAGSIASEWPSGTDGFTVQLTTVSKDGATAETVDAAREQAVADGAIDAAVLDSDLYSSLPPGNYVIYSGVYTDRDSAEVALKGLRKDFSSAAVVEVSDGGGASEDAAAEPPAEEATPPVGEAPDGDTGGAQTPITPEVGGESEVPPPASPDDVGGGN
jgi:hypothetical protein